MKLFYLTRDSGRLLAMNTLITTPVVSEVLLSSSTALTLADRRLYNYLLLNAYDGIKKKSSFSIELKELQGVYEVGLPPVERVQESLRRLIRTLVEYSIQGKAEYAWRITPLLAEATLDTHKKVIHYCYSENCLFLLTQPILLEKCLVQAHFTAKYSNLLYDLLANEHYAGKNIYQIETEDLRARLKVDSDKMPNFTDFNRYVLMPALNEIHCYASFAVKADFVRQGRKITHVHFTFTCKTPVAKTRNIKSVIPPKRPQLFIESPAEQFALAFLLNASTEQRRHYFKRAQQKAKRAIPEQDFDRPDQWYRWVVKEINTAGKI
jgi:hypothetical protein